VLRKPAGRVFHVKHADPVEERLQAYEALLASWAPRFDLISPGDLGRIRERHIDDSLRALPLLEPLGPGLCMDVGSGAGLPGVPLAIASGRPWRLLEPRRKRAAFLEEVLRELSLADCEVVALSAEQAALEPRYAAGHVAVTARALAPPTEAARLCNPLIAPHGVAILFVGRAAEIPPEAEENSPGLITIRRDAH
jgi:16S rRNA (guanine527-N7)-methyltransferase